MAFLTGPPKAVIRRSAANGISARDPVNWTCRSERLQWRMFDVCSISASATGIEVLRLHTRKAEIFQRITDSVRNLRSHQVQRMSAAETEFTPPEAVASVQPHPHKRLKQRKNSAAAGSGECLRAGKWRRRWDSNPRWAFTHVGFQDRCNRPLCHSSGPPAHSGTCSIREAAAAQVPKTAEPGRRGLSMAQNRM